MHSRSLSVSFHHRAFTLFGFGPRITPAREARASNAQLHDCPRTRIELGALRVFQSADSASA